VTDGVVNMAATDADAAPQLEIPGTCYIKLLHQITADIFTGRQLYLSGSSKA